MPSVPTWREPIYKKVGHKNANWALELHRPNWNDPRIPKCEAIAKSTGEKCKKPAVRGCNKCRTHHGTRYLEKRIEKGLSARVYSETNPYFTCNDPENSRTTKANLAPHIVYRKTLSKSYGRFYANEGLFLKEQDLTVRRVIMSQSTTKRLHLFLKWEQKNLDPRAWTQALKELINEQS